MKLTICICALQKRLPLLSALLKHLHDQANKYPGQVEILVECDGGEISTGAKRNKLYQTAQGEYVCSVDDDDWVSDWYVEDILKALETNPDTVGINGWMSTDGRNIESWAISIFNPYHTQKRLGRNFYLRPPNHLSPMKREIALRFPFPDKYVQEDYDFCMSIHNANALKTEVLIQRPMYEYRYKTKK